MPEMEPVIGLEIHAQLKTRTKLFCDCPTAPADNPNVNICEICTGQPGALPRMNAKALELAAKAGLALGSTVNLRSLFSRKNYFYPDLPNGFQTSQLDPPICSGGSMEIGEGEGKKSVRLNRIHLEDDAGKNIHDERRGRTLVDLNRAGTPLIEIVTEPDLGSSSEAMEFMKKLHALLVRLDVTEGRLEEGEFRCDVNVSLKPKGSSVLGVRGEIKNLNSFRHVGQAIDYEIKRQTQVYASGGAVKQETLHFDPSRHETRVLRSKEEAHDYRYFPQPDLPPIKVEAPMLEALRLSLPVPVEETLARLEALGVKSEQARLLTDRKEAADYFDQAVSFGADPKRLSALMAELFLPACQKADILPLSAALSPESMAKLAKLIDSDKLGRRAAYEMFPSLFGSGGDPEKMAKDKGVLQISDDSALTGLARQVISEHQEEVAKYKGGQEKLLSFLVGQVMRRSQGAADPKGAAKALKDLIDGGSL
ncbi:MAG: Asp-tRNA(Asn)/Glu-tRNA(Gln) amidotransferase subunit GatB [Deltaproteobacteria bacterium]|jgi:aspartyl-tRNA(Asn)/glutamyl-tRNA(Gln) amidotransferase subunit B|nr:Asp-tRNA(Asn)/Glu-tRNA(Gln) amidotransferase subunit GatB [Deltaproteobacteria bacterium]